MAGVKEEHIVGFSLDQSVLHPLCTNNCLSKCPVFKILTLSCVEMFSVIHLHRVIGFIVILIVR